MSRSRKRKKPLGKKPRVGAGMIGPRSGSKADGEARRSTLKDVLLGIAVSLLILGLLEGGLRISGLPSVDASEDPYVGFSRIKPLYQVHEGVASTAPDKIKYFNQVSFKARKPLKTFRVFAFGGSTTYGRPFDGRTSFSRWLQDLLNAMDPGTSFEVINAGGISYASYRIVPLIKETLRYEPDLVVIYTGHNEFLERRTYEGLFSQGAGLVTVRSVLEKLRLYQVLKLGIEPLLPAALTDDGSKSDEVSPKGDAGGTSSRRSSRPNKSILKDEVTAILDRSAGLDRYHRDEEFSRGVIQHFAHNLETMIRVCRKAGVPVILIEPSSNLKDFSPFKSEHRKDLTVREKSALDGKIAQAVDLVKRGDYEAGLAGLNEAIEQDPQYAETYYWRGKAMLGMGKYEKARDDFVKARDLDVCPLRCITPLKETMREVSGRERVPLIRSYQALADRIKSNGDASGIPGNESFMDHVHPTVEGHQLLAELIAGEMIRGKMAQPARHLSREEMDALYDKGMKGLDTRFFATKDLNLAKVLRWAGKKDESRRVLLRTKEQLGDNPEVHKMLGSFLLEDGRYEEAIEAYKKSVKLSGNDPLLKYSLANAYYKAGLRSEAQEIYENLLESDQPMPEASANLATIHLEQGRVDRALVALREALARTPDAESLFSPYALALAISGEPAEAIPWMVRAVEAEPGDPGLLYNLAGMYALSGSPQDALRTLDQAVDKGYAGADKMVQDPIFSSIRDLPEFARIVGRIR
ncbi:MAG: tetratricopeptide repeat protein [Desulfomonilaceae bacterium]|nr:tetratricopeptide repeat protein [Desulfomonilaceae bacterium]